jgi:DNA modification methylase
MSSGKPVDKAGGRIEVVYRGIETLRPDPHNPRRHTRQQIKQIAESIQAFGFNVPILVDRDLQVIAGHGRLLACRELGWTEVPTISLDHLSEAQAKAFLIADNRLTEIATWDDRLLAEQLKELSVLDLDFRLEATGFHMGEIDFRIESLNAPAAADPDDDVEEPQGPAVSRPGDLWLCGPHRLFCGNAVDAGAYRTLMAGEQAAMVFSDPPYNVPIDGHATGLGATQHRDFAMASGEMDTAAFTRFLTDACGLLAANSRDGALHFIAMDWRHMGEILAAGRASYSALKNLCVWVKTNAGWGSLYRNQHELVFVFKKGIAQHRNNVELGKHGRNRTNVWEYGGANSFGRVSEEGNLLALHPTVKPVALVADAILDASARGEVVLDGFLGSGTTLMAAERVGRRCYALEIDPLYVDTAIRRWQRLTGDDARHAITGERFNDRAGMGAAA